MSPWLDHRVLVCLGGGGVGKTTAAAAIALAAARAGRRALVLTVDPARRLAGALGLATLAGQPQPVATGGLAPAGHLAAMMIDQAGAWDRLLARHASAGTRARLAASRFYQVLSRRFAGTTDYLAIDELAALSGAFDLIVLDTPPGERAALLLEAPARAAALLDRRVLRWLPRLPGVLAGELERATGSAGLADLTGFLAAAAELADVLAARARAARDLLAARGTGVLLLATPDSRAITAALALAAAAGRLGLELAGCVLNRVHAPWPEPVAPAALRAELAAAGLAADADWLADNFAAHERRARGEARRADRLRALLPAGLPAFTIPAFDADVHDLAALSHMAAALTDGAARSRSPCAAPP